MSRVFEKSSKGIQICFKEVYRVYQERFYGASRKFQECFNGVLCGFQGWLKEVCRAFQRSFKGVSRKIEGCS